jgi:alkanesulfonate monooxygenase SsuD/methylene tetrahydromethanopterin reductase-like flavin-dependent oxidoreductase (luciferase family)
VTAYNNFRFGFNIDPAAAPAADFIRLGQLAEDSGFDLIGIQDHPYQSNFLDSWALITYLLAKTERIAFSSNVGNLGLRPPAMLAKAASSLAVLEPGRVHLGVGAGAVGPGVPSMGMTGRDGKAMLQYAEESVGILRKAVRGGPVRLETTQTHIRGYTAGPVPSPTPEVWLGSNLPKMLEVTGRSADGWLAGISLAVPPREIPQRRKVIDDAAQSVGRKPTDVRRIYNVAGVVGVNHGRGFVGSAKDWTEWITDWALNLGFDSFVFWPMDDPYEQAVRFGNEVIPAVWEAMQRIWETR